MIKEFPNFPWQSELLVMLFWWADPSVRTSHDVNYVWLHPLYPDDFLLSDSRRHAGEETAAWPVSHDKILPSQPASLFLVSSFFLSSSYAPPRHHSIFLPFPPCPIWRRALKGAFFLFTSTTKNSALASVFQVVWVLRYSSVHVKKRMTGRCSIWDQLLKLVLRIGKLVFILH